MNYFLLSVIACILVNILCIAKLWLLVPVDEDGSVNLDRKLPEKLKLFLKRWGFIVIINLIGAGTLAIGYFYKVPILSAIDCLIILVFSTIMYVSSVDEEIRYHSSLVTGHVVSDTFKQFEEEINKIIKLYNDMTEQVNNLTEFSKSARDSINTLGENDKFIYELVQEHEEIINSKDIHHKTFKHVTRKERVHKKVGCKHD